MQTHLPEAAPFPACGETAEQAEEAGYRPCLRCRPKESDAQVRLVTHACRLIEQHLDRRLSLADLAAGTGVSSYHLLRLFGRVLDISPRQFSEQRRFDRLRRSLRREHSVTDAIYAAGFSSASRVYENARRFLGMTPLMYRRNGAGAAMTYWLSSTRFGILLVASTALGVCSVGLGAEPQSLIAELHDEFSRAAICPAAGAGIAPMWPAALDSVPPDIRLTAIRRSAFGRVMFDDSLQFTH